MSVRVPFRLTRRPTPGRAAAVLLTSPTPADLVALLAPLADDHPPHVFAVDGGFLVVPEGELPAALPSVVRLRRVSENLFVPADADLVPPLAPAEAADLTRRRGLVVLPGGRSLAFDPAANIAVWSLVAAGQTRRDRWEPFPPRPPRAERLTAILVQPPPPPEAILDEGMPDGGDDDLQPPESSLADRATARVQAGLGKTLAWLGSKLGSEAIGNAGKSMIQRAMDRMPRLSEKLLGKQEAALRELLRLFRSGDAEKALRHALPFGMPGDGRIVPATDARLPTVNPLFSLASLLGGWGRGGTFAAWFGGTPEIWRDLHAEYRRLAQAAVARGDHKRAAYIYGRLLGDLRTAADVLAAGGFHREAAILYRDKVGDNKLAAAAFERAGDADEALRLYRHVGDHAAAGDLLRKLGDDDAAVDEYILAAEGLLASAGHFAAGCLMRDRARRADLAADYFTVGWLRRPAADSRACAEGLFDYCAQDDDLAPLVALVNEADAYYRHDDSGDDGPRFFNFVATASRRPPLGPIADNLRDRAKLFLAGRLRDRPSATTVAATFGRNPLWPAPLIRDAEFAVRRRPRKSEVVPTTPTVRLVNGPVTAVAFARETGDAIVAGGGEVVVWHAATAALKRVTATNRDVHAIACDPTAELVVTCVRDGPIARLRGFVVGLGNDYQFRVERQVVGSEEWEPTLLPHIGRGPNRFETYVQSTPGDLDVLAGPGLLPRHPMKLPETTECLLYAPGPTKSWWWHRGRVTHSTSSVAAGLGVTAPWSPAASDVAAFDFAAHDNRLELAAVSASRSAAYLGVTANRNTTLLTTAYDATANFVATALYAPERVVGVTAGNEVRWLRVRDGELKPAAASQVLPVPSRAVAVIARVAARDVAVIFADGTAARVPLPLAPTLCPGVR